jgi:hypothetical protein
LVLRNVYSNNLMSVDKYKYDINISMLYITQKQLFIHHIFDDITVGGCINMNSPRLYLRDGLKYMYTQNCYNSKHPSSRVECALYTCMICTTGLSQKKSVFYRLMCVFSWMPTGKTQATLKNLHIYVMNQMNLFR